MSLAIRVLIGLLVGLAGGIAVSSSHSPALMAASGYVEPLGTLFINAIRMTVIPLVVASVIVGVALFSRRAQSRPHRHGGAPVLGRSNVVCCRDFQRADRPTSVGAPAHQPRGRRCCAPRRRFKHHHCGRRKEATDLFAVAG